MRIYKRACATTECSNTCPGTNCIPPGERITVGVRCWMNWHSQTGYERQYTSTTFDIVSVLESAYSSKYATEMFLVALFHILGGEI